MASELPSTARLAEKARRHEATSGFRRDRITWTCYLALALFTYFRNIQGNIIPFLRDELGLSYREVSLYPAALAAGLIVCGLFGERAVAWCGRRGALAPRLCRHLRRSGAAQPRAYSHREHHRLPAHGGARRAHSGGGAGGAGGAAWRRPVDRVRGGQ